MVFSVKERGGEGGGGGGGGGGRGGGEKMTCLYTLNILISN